MLEACVPDFWSRRNVDSVSVRTGQRPETKKAALVDGLLFITGAGDRNRTYDPIITNDVLYQLSYSGAGREF
jgi:hypothetical protein